MIVKTIKIIAIYLYFYRENPLYIRSNKNILFSPSYGTIKSIIYKNNTIFIAIFLSPLDIHYQYIPIDGTLVKTKHRKICTGISIK